MQEEDEGEEIKERIPAIVIGGPSAGGRGTEE
jgi:hypothetical protein